MNPASICTRREKRGKEWQNEKIKEQRRRKEFKKIENLPTKNFRFFSTLNPAASICTRIFKIPIEKISNKDCFILSIELIFSSKIRSGF